MDYTRKAATSASEQDIRPSDFSISGGNYYDNNIQIDGVTNTSIMDTTKYEKNDTYNVSGQTSQTLYIHPSLIKDVDVFDSNVSAETGNFTGGVVNYKLREPADEFGFNLSVGYQSDPMVDYKLVGDKNLDDLEPEPSFQQYTTSIAFDLPINDQISLLTSYSKSTSTADYTTADVSSVSQANYRNSDTSENFLLKGRYVGDETSVIASVIYSPYRSQYREPNTVNSDQNSRSDGLQTSLEVSRFDYGFDWSAKASYNKNDASREWHNIRYVWNEESAYQPAGCNGCNEGGWGDLTQKQEDLSFDFKGSRSLAGGELGLGYQFTHTKGYRSRPEDLSYYYIPIASSGTD